MDELEDALSTKDITLEQYNLAINTSQKLRDGLLSILIILLHTLLNV
jgi:predicted RNA-binding protein associated with RNAse of E/G family